VGIAKVSGAVSCLEWNQSELTRCGVALIKGDTKRLIENFEAVARGEPLLLLIAGAACIMFLKGPNVFLTYALLALCALLEVGGDAIVRLGLHTDTHSGLRRGLTLAVGALVLFAYGLTVNSIRWDFGKLLGVYVAMFFIVAQAVAWIGFGEKPRAPVVAGGLFIIVGAGIIQWWRP